MSAKEAHETCGHTSTDFIGANHGTIFLRCLLCGWVLIRQGSRVWVMPPTPPRSTPNP
jgi:hypothetical protein